MLTTALFILAAGQCDSIPGTEWGGAIEGPMSVTQSIGYGMSFGLLGVGVLAAPAALPDGGRIAGALDGAGAIAVSAAALSDNQPLTGVWSLLSGGALVMVGLELDRRDVRPRDRFLVMLGSNLVYLILAGTASAVEDSYWPSEQAQEQREQACLPSME